MAQGSAPLPECGWKHARFCFWRPWHGMATTTVEAKTGCGPDPAAEMKILRVLAGLKREPVDVIATLLARGSESPADLRLRSATEAEADA